MYRLQTQARIHGSLTAIWLAKWHLLSPTINPRHSNRIPLKLETDWTPHIYLLNGRQNRGKRTGCEPVTSSSPSRRQRRPSLRSVSNGSGLKRVGRRCGRLHGERLQKNRGKASFTILSQTQERLFAIRRAQNDACRTCMMDTLRHRLAECGDRRHQWEWARNGLTPILRTDPRWVYDEWLYRPQFQVWSPKRQRAVLWTPALLVTFRT
jgi:hypothetical protein